MEFFRDLDEVYKYSNYYYRNLCFDGCPIDSECQWGVCVCENGWNFFILNIDHHARIFRHDPVQRAMCEGHNSRVSGGWLAVSSESKLSEPGY